MFNHTSAGSVSHPSFSAHVEGDGSIVFKVRCKKMERMQLFVAWDKKIKKGAFFSASLYFNLFKIYHHFF